MKKQKRALSGLEPVGLLYTLRQIGLENHDANKKNLNMQPFDNEQFKT
jgi:hypothetical protein